MTVTKTPWLLRVVCAASLAWLGPMACGDDDGSGGRGGAGRPVSRRRPEGTTR